MSDLLPDLLTLGRCSIDLYSNDLGLAFADIQQLNACMGGSPLNIVVGANWLEVRSALLTAVGEDQVGGFILTNLQREQTSPPIWRMLSWPRWVG